ncbi:P-loop NTPase fold protein [Amycolatopsis sp. NPDC001319]|uniref:P-loop NTPase fold protein n=1 Tax=unclassified Amycolatopsis TaxID=2618356 RepID=UPI0036902EDF
MVAPAFDAYGYSLDAHGPGADRFVVLNDAPLGEGDGADLLETTQVARGLADLVVASRAAAPFALAVDAAWGMGKSSLMRELESTLAAEPAVSVVWFNAWTSGRASALEGLIKSVLLRFDRNLVRRAVRSIQRQTHLLGVLRAAALVSGSVFGLGRLVDEIWRALSVDARSRNQMKGVLRDLFAAWLAKGERAGDRRLLVVFVDDLDRCAAERIVEVCEAIKLYLDVPGVVFVLACDQAVLSKAVQGSAAEGEPAGAVEYLEKIIQINYRIPPPSTASALRLVDGYLEMSRTAGLFDESMKSVIIERSGRNPRRIKRLINSFVLEYHLNRSWDEFGGANLVRVVLLQHFYPAFYGILVNPREADPIRDFLRYHEFRGRVRHGEAEDRHDWRELFTDKRLRQPDPEQRPLTESLAELERELPAQFPLLAADHDFVALLESLDGPVNSDQFRRLLRKPLTGGPALSPPDPAYLAPLSQPRQPLAATGRDVDLAGLRVLWIDDNPVSNRRVIERLSNAGAVVTTATDRTSAFAAALREGEPDVVLSDFTRAGDPFRGVDDLAYIRERGLYHGPVIFCSGQRLPQLLRRVEELDAIGPTNDENEIVRWVERIAEVKASARPPS